MKRSKWFPVSQKPALKGWYQFKGALWPTERMMLWTGKRWEMPNWPDEFPTKAGDQWRGLAEKPNE